MKRDARQLKPQAELPFRDSTAFTVSIRSILRSPAMGAVVDAGDIVFSMVTPAQTPSVLPTEKYNWRNPLFKGIGIGIGICIGIGAALFIVPWYQAHFGHEWLKKEIRTTYSREIYEMGNNLELKGILEEYVVENTSRHDYRLSPSFLMMVKMDGSLEAVQSYKLEQECFIPAGQKVKCEIRVPDEYNSTYPVEEITIFDTAMRYEIDFPKPTHPTPDERKNNEKWVIDPPDKKG
jgi:hypothetical protein